MPIDVFVPGGVLEPNTVAALGSDLTETLLRWTDATENEFFRSNVSVVFHELPQERVFAGGTPATVARVDVKVPSVALSTQERRSGFTADATELLRKASAHRFAHVWVFIANAIDGGWGIDGKALTNEDLS